MTCFKISVGSVLFTVECRQYEYTVKDISGGLVHEGRIDPGDTPYNLHIAKDVVSEFDVDALVVPENQVALYSGKFEDIDLMVSKDL